MEHAKRGRRTSRTTHHFVNWFRIAKVVGACSPIVVLISGAAA